MRKYLLLALLLYNIVALATRSNNYEYDDVDGNKRHSLFDDRRNWRKKALLSPSEQDHKEYDTRKRHDYDSTKYYDDPESYSFGGIERLREGRTNYRKRYEDLEKLPEIKSAELGPHTSSYFNGKKSAIAINCDRPHERYESCFSGCASVTCDNPRERLHSCYPFCEPGCICIAPYVRDDRTHKCVMPDECTKGLKGIPDLGEEI